MARYNDFYNQFKTSIRRLVDTTNRDLVMDDNFLSGMFTQRSYDDYEVLTATAQRNRAIAKVVSFGAEIPPSKGGQLSIIENSMIKMGKRILFTEEDQKNMRRWQNRAQGIPNSAMEFIFGSITDMQMAIMKLRVMLATEIMWSGQISFTDTDTGNNISVDYRPTDTASTQFPAALAGTATWDDAANATPLDDLQEHCESYPELIKIGRPDYTMMNMNTYRKLRDTDHTRAILQETFAGNSSTSTNFRAGREDINRIFDTMDIPPLMIVENAYQTETIDTSGDKPEVTLVDEYYIPDGYYAFGWRRMGEMALGPVESNNGQSGVHVFSREVTKEPPVDEYVGVATGCILIDDGRKLGGRKVY